MALAAVPRVDARFGEERLECHVARLGPERVGVHSGRHLVNPVDVPDDLLQHPADVVRADVHRVGAAQRLRAPRRQLGVAAHRVLELRPVRLHPPARAGRGADRAAEQHVVREHEVGRQQLVHGARVRSDVGLALRVREVLQQTGLEPLVLVEHEHRQQPVGQLGHDDLCAAEVVAVGVPLLADDDDVVARAAPLARKRARVHVRAGPPEQIAVPEDDAHGGECRYARWK